MNRFCPTYLVCLWLVLTFSAVGQVPLVTNDQNAPGTVPPQDVTWTYSKIGNNGKLCSLSHNGIETCYGSGSGSGLNFNVGGGTAQAQTVTIPGNCPTSLAAGQIVYWLPIAINTGSAPTLSVCSLGAKTITKLGATPLVANDLTTTAVASAIYDGTQYQLQNPQTNASGGGVTYTGTPTTNALVTSASGATIQTGLVAEDSSGNLSTSGAYVSGAGSGKTGLDCYVGTTSGMICVSAPDAAGATIGYLYPTAPGGNNLFMTETSASCSTWPTPPAGSGITFPTTCYQESWTAIAGYIAAGTLTSSQILNLGTAVQVIAAPGSGSMIVVDAMTMELIFGGTAYASGGTVSASYTTSFLTAAGPACSSSFVQSTSTSVCFPAGGTTSVQQPNSLVVNAPLYIYSTANFTGGNGTINYWIKYRVLTGF